MAIYLGNTKYNKVYLGATEIKKVYLGNQLVYSGYPAVIDDGNTVAWFDAQENITKDGSNLVSVWGDKTGLARHLLQTTSANQPLWSTNGILFDGANDFMKCAAFEWNQPSFIYMVFRNVTWTFNDYIFDGNITDRIVGYIGTTTPEINLYGGSSVGVNKNLAVNTFGVVRFLANGAASFIKVNSTAAVNGNVGTNKLEGFTLGGRSNGANNSNIEVKEIIGRKVADTADDEATIYAYLSTKYGI